MRRFFAALVAALAFTAPHAGAADAAAALGDNDRQCLTCHGEKGLEKEFAKGDSVSLHVDPAAFARSVHAPAGCAACHADVDLKKHPGSSKAFPSSRAYAVAMSGSCRGCHESSVDAHVKSVHGRDAAGNAAAPLCVTCHTSHEIARVSASLRENCFACHADSQAQHAKWLPNAKTHFNVVSCAACHAPSAGKRVELRFYDVKTKSELVTDGKPLNGGASEKPMDAENLRALVHAVEEGGAGGNVLLVGRVEPLKQGEGHNLLPKAQAVKDCAACHRKGADPFQTVSLSLVGPDGTRTSFDAHKDVLSSPTSVDSVRGFYAMGGTRIQILDIVLGLALIGGISAPLGHLVVRRILRKKEKRHE
jgi:hypothetical protein